VDIIHQDLDSKSKSKCTHLFITLNLNYLQKKLSKKVSLKEK